MSPAVRLHVESHGSGPVVVLAHGFGGSARNFRNQQRALAQQARIIAYDARGHARSDAPEEAEAYVFERLVDDYERVVEEHAGEPVVAGGLSLGVVTALAFARRRPELVRGLLLASLPNTGDKRRIWAAGFAEAVKTRGLEAAGAEYVWGERSRFDPAGAKLIRQGLIEHPPHGLAGVLESTLTVLPDPVALASELADRTLPAAIIAGAEDHDALLPSQRIAALLPQAELLVVPGAGHVVNLAAPQAFNDALKALLGRLQPLADRRDG